MAQGTILEAKKYARINDPGCTVVVEKPIRKVQKISAQQQEQFNTFFQDKAHVVIVVMSSYKTRLPCGKNSSIYIQMELKGQLFMQNLKETNSFTEKILEACVLHVVYMDMKHLRRLWI